MTHCINQRIKHWRPIFAKGRELISVDQGQAFNKIANHNFKIYLSMLVLCMFFNNKIVVKM